MSEVPPAGNPADQPPQEELTQGSEQIKVIINPPKGNEVVVSTDSSSEISPPQPTAPQSPPGLLASYDQRPIDTLDQSNVIFSAPAGDEIVVNPKAPHVDGANYEHDEAKAEAMAYATKDFRGKAADNRVIEQTRSEGYDMVSGLRDMTDQEPSSLHPLKRRQYQKRLEAANEAYLDFRHDNNDPDLAADRQAHKDIPEFQDSLDPAEEQSRALNAFPQTTHRKPEERAEAYDRRADRIETWAGALHDHPLSVEFKKAHPGIQFQPKALVRMEDKLQTLKREISDKEQDTYRETAEVVKGMTNPPRWLLQDAESADRHQQITTALINQAKTLDAFYNGRIDELRIQPLRDQLAMTRNVLNDVRREVGLDVESDDPEVENQDQVPAEVSGADTKEQPQGD
jgi:hypothetical protein